MYNKPFVFRSIFSPSLLVWYEDEHTVSFSFFFFENRVIFRRINIPYSRMTRFCSSFFYHLLIRKIEIASFPFSLVKCFFFFFYLTTIRFHFLTRFEDKCSRMLFLWWQYTNAFFYIFPNNFENAIFIKYLYNTKWKIYYLKNYYFPYRIIQTFAVKR